MHAKLLIDAIVHQTTVLIAELSTASGIKAPLSHVADQVFLDLSRSIEAQGVSRRVVADMFGLAIRTYQKKVQRLTESVTLQNTTLWQAVLERLGAVGSLSRRELAEVFHRDDPVVVGSVLNDLVSSGLVYKTGAGDTTVYGITQQADLARTIREREGKSLGPIAWVTIYRNGPTTRAMLEDQFSVAPETLDRALAALEAEGRVQRTGQGADAVFTAETFLVPVESESGWEAAVFDHFQTVVRAIATKLRRGAVRSAADDVNGGATLTFDISASHVHREAVLGLLWRVRQDVNELWSQVQEHNASHPIPESERTQVSFYFGQCVTLPDED